MEYVLSLYGCIHAEDPHHCHVHILLVSSIWLSCSATTWTKYTKWQVANQGGSKACYDGLISSAATWHKVIWGCIGQWSLGSGTTIDDICMMFLGFQQEQATVHHHDGISDHRQPHLMLPHTGNHLANTGCDEGSRFFYPLVFSPFH